jgi:hypothetical protein
LGFIILNLSERSSLGQPAPPVRQILGITVSPVPKGGSTFKTPEGFKAFPFRHKPALKARPTAKYGFMSHFYGLTRLHQQAPLNECID